MLDRLVEWVASEAVRQSEKFLSYEAKSKFADSLLNLSNTLFGGVVLALIAQATEFGILSTYAALSTIAALIGGELFRRAGLRVYDAAVQFKTIEDRGCER